MSICPKNKSSKGRRDKRRANWKMSAPNLVKCSKCGELMMPHSCLLYTSITEYIAKASMEPRDYRVVFLIQKSL